MKVIIVPPGSSTPTTCPTPASISAGDKPLKAKAPSNRATKALMLTRIKEHRERARIIIKNGDRRIITPEVMLWVERPMPSDTNTLDVLRGIEHMLSKGVPQIPENPEVKEKLISNLNSWHMRAKNLWSKGAGGLLPPAAGKASVFLKSAKANDLSITQIKGLILDLGGTL